MIVHKNYLRYMLPNIIWNHLFYITVDSRPKRAKSGP